MEGTDLASWHRRLDVIAHSVRVKDIAQPMVRVDADWSLEDSLSEIMLEDYWFGTVVDGPQVLGYIALDDHADGDTARQAALPIPFGQIVEESSPILEVVHLFQRHPFFFGLRNNTVSSVVSWQDVDSMLGRIVVMALIMEFELALDDALRHREDEVTNILTAARRKLAEDQLHRKLKQLNPRSGRPPTLYSCLYLADKAKAARVLLRTENGSPWRHKRSIRSSFQRIEGVRNEVAHGGSLLAKLPKPTDIADFFETLRYSITWLRRPENQPVINL